MINENCTTPVKMDLITQNFRVRGVKRNITQLGIIITRIVNTYKQEITLRAVYRSSDETFLIFDVL